MKKISILLVLLMVGFSSILASDKTTINRMVLKAVQEFDKVNVTGDVTVELRYNPDRAGYIVYHYDKNADKKIRCFNDENVLHVQGSSDAVMTRIVVFYGNPLTSIVYNGDARLVAHRLKCSADGLDLLLNGSGDVKLGRVKSKKVNAVLNGSGNLTIVKVKIDNFNVVINGSGEVVLKEKPENLNVIKNGAGTVTSASQD